MAAEEGVSRGVEQRWALVLPYREHMLAIARRRCSSDEDAEDVVQEAMLRVAQFDRLDPERVAALLTSVTKRLAVDLHRARTRALRYRTRLVDVPEHQAPPDEAALDAGEALWLAAQVQYLPEREREVFRQRVAGYSIGEASARLGLSYKSVDSAFIRARGRMRAWATAGLLLVIATLRRLRERPEVIWGSMAIVSAGCLILTSLPGQTSHNGPRPVPRTAMMVLGPRPAAFTLYRQAGARPPRAPAWVTPTSYRSPTGPPPTPQGAHPQEIVHQTVPVPGNSGGLTLDLSRYHQNGGVAAYAAFVVACAESENPSQQLGCPPQ